MIKPILTGLACAFMAVAASHACADSVRECRKDYAVKNDISVFEPDIQRQYDLKPVIFNKGSNGTFDVFVKFHLNSVGKITCVERPDTDDGGPWLMVFPMAALRQAATSWRYKPFLVNGVATSVWSGEIIRFIHAPVPPVTPPQANLTETSFTHMRTNCYGPCRAYTVTIHGDGRVEYHGDVADLTGTLSYRLPESEVKALIARQGQRDLWNKQDHYVSAQYDASHNMLILKAGQAKKSIHDYIGESIGMPSEVKAAEDDIDQVAQIALWLNLTPESLTRLDEMHYDFKGPRAADMLVNMISNPQTSDATIFAVLDRGAPLTGIHTSHGMEVPVTLPVDSAIYANRPEVVEGLIAKGALPDQARINSAFQAAISSGKLTYMQRLNTLHPDLTYEVEYKDYSVEPAKVSLRKQSVLFLIDPGEEALPLLTYLAGIGADIKAKDAEGRTLLHHLCDDLPSARYLIAQRVDINAKDESGQTALMMVMHEEAVLYLLNAGADPALMTDGVQSLFAWAKERNWSGVPAWLIAHGYKAPPE